MFEQRDKRHNEAPKQPEGEHTANDGQAANDEVRQRHGRLVSLMREELGLQYEERFQMAVDEDFHDHLQWTVEDASALMARGQAPAVFNEGRLSIEWITGTEKRNRIDYKILPREPNDEKGAEVQTKVVKYTDDVNLSRFHRSRAFKQAAVSGLGWLEEGINTEPDQEIIYSGSVDWRDVIRDSRSREVDYNKDGRYLFRRRKLDLDYVIALMPQSKGLLLGSSYVRDNDDPDEITEKWYLGERLTAAHDQDYATRLPSSYRDRGAYIGTSQMDGGRRSAVDLIEAWYKEPEEVQVFMDGPFAGKVADERNIQMAKAKSEGWRVYKSVRWVMRCMIMTEEHWLWDGPSPFQHNKFPLIPVWAYRRAGDGMAYGVWRGMRDAQVDINKRMSKALWAASANQVIADDDAVEDVEEARQEIARPDAWIAKKRGAELKKLESTADVQTSLQLADRSRMHLQNVSGVTPENMGRDTNASSGKAIIAKQSQGGMTTAELFENLRLSIQLAGQLRLSNIKQFMTARKVIRILGEAKPVEYLTINEFDPETGEFLNDVTATQADFIVSEQDWRANLQAAALEQFIELLKVIGPVAPNAVVNLLDLIVEQFDLPMKDEIVRRVRELNGQRDPTKNPTPEEQAAKQAAQEQVAAEQKLMMERVMAELAEIRAKTAQSDATATAKQVEALYMALQAGQIVATVPGVAPVADTIAKSAGFKDQDAATPAIPAAPQMPTMPAVPDAVQADGGMTGIETPQNDGAIPPQL